jgi:hypothetical protein
MVSLGVCLHRSVSSYKSKSLEFPLRFSFPHKLFRVCLSWLIKCYNSHTSEGIFLFLGYLSKYKTQAFRIFQRSLSSNQNTGMFLELTVASKVNSSSSKAKTDLHPFRISILSIYTLFPLNLFGKMPSHSSNGVSGSSIT